MDLVHASTSSDVLLPGLVQAMQASPSGPALRSVI
jgi:hypothetical protein